MKQNGVRLVQRKFAQGVPIPASSSTIAPPPPERKPEPSYPPKNVYQNKMSARSLLDIVSMQNIHKHKQEPLVVLERLRADEIPPPPAPRLRVGLRKQRALKVNENNMCLRSGKRKSTDAAKGCARKRKKLSSESTDDLPLMYYLNRLNLGKPHPTHKPKETVADKKERSLEREKRTQTPKRKERRAPGTPDKPVAMRTQSMVSDKSDDQSFTFKEPSSPVRPSYRLFKKKAAAKADKKPPKPPARKGPKTVNKEKQRPSLPGPSGSGATKSPPTDIRSPLGPPPVSSAPSPTLSFDLNVESASGENWCVNINPDVKSEISGEEDIIKLKMLRSPRDSENKILAEIKDEEIETNNDFMVQQAKENSPEERFNVNSNTRQKGDLNKEIDCQTSNVEPAIIADVEMKETEVAGNSDQSVNSKISNETAPMDVDREKNAVVEESSTSKVKPKAIAKKAVKKSAPKEKRDSRKPAAKPNSKENKKTKPKQNVKPVSEETPASTRLLRNSREPQQVPNPDVYEFDAELEASRPPSSLRRRGPATPDPPPPAPNPTSPENVEYVDILSTSSHYIQITPKKQQESGTECLSVSLVPKEEISIKKKKNLIENLSNSPALLNKFFNCLTAELQNELDNLITAEGLDDQASTSKEEASTYLDQKARSVFEAPTFYPTAEEFADPIKYYDKIAPQASKYGLCKIVPPDGFKPPCNMSDTIRFAVIYQYISKMYSRWGPVSRELAAIKAHLRTQSVVFARSPLLDGSEVNLPKLYHAVERNGGLSNVIQRKRWGRVADEMKLTKLQHPERRLDPIYMRYLLPYATLSDQERQNIMAEVEKCWTTKYQKMLERARNPFQRQNRMLGTEYESESDDEGEDGNTAGALHEAEDCIVQGRTMNLITFKKISTSLMDAHFEPSKQPPSAINVEKAYWRAVLLGTEHIVANTASIDTGEEGYGFPKDPEARYGTHSWNLKVLARNPNNVLRYLGPVLGVTVPTLHLSMLFSTSCWHRDPHGLPWIEYMHSGAEKIWYGIPRDESANFRRAVETLCPAYCQNKSIWLASEITMVPPNILSEHGVRLSRLLQRPGEYVLVFPEAHSCSITTGFGIAESVYFASNAWLTDVYKLFQELRNSCEPTMFSLEQLLLNGSADCGAPQQVCPVLCTLLNAELEHRRALEHRGLKMQERPAPVAPLNTSYFRAWNARDQDECEYCRSTLFLSKVTGLTGRNSAVCPEHALRLLETKKHKNVDLTTLEFLSSYTTNALEEMLDRLETRITEEQSRAPSVIDLTGPEVPRESEPRPE